MATRYATVDKLLTRSPDAIDEILRNRYGVRPEARRSHKPRTPALTLSWQCDAGSSMLVQRSKVLASRRSAALSAAVSDERHARIGPLDLPVPPEACGAVTVPPPDGGRESSEPPPAAHAARAAEGGRAIHTPDAPADAPPPPRTQLPGADQGATARLENAHHDRPEGETAGASENDFLADMQSIFAGEKVYDPVTRKTVRKSDLKEYPREHDAADTAPVDGGRPAGIGASDSQAIFDRIARSMQYAGAYDLGEVELENRFRDFERMDDLQRQAASRKGTKTADAHAPSRRASPQAASVESADFLQDLAVIRKHSDAGVSPKKAQDPRGQESIPKRYSAPLYATGEHVLPGEDLYRDGLVVGKAPGVPFSYGQIIAMADLFASPEEMMQQDAALLQNVKRLIEQSAAYYKGGAGSGLTDVPDEKWEEATQGRYLKLAADNYDHFAPDFLVRDTRVASRTRRYGNHRVAWERYHEQAIREAQRMALEAGASRSYIPSWPLIINAFGDHFLTDAFAAGHVVNKEGVIEHFKSRFLTGSSLTPEANVFLDKVAQKAWRGRLADEFAKLETAEPYDAWWNTIFRWNPNINSAERFASLLKSVAEQEPDKVANFAVKAIHDRLNREGVDVINDAGSPPWKLTGDGHLTPTTLEIMKRAVATSAGTIIDPAILASNISIPSYFAKVWAYVPRLAPGSEAKVEKLVARYVNPESSELVDAAVAIIERELDLLIRMLIEKKALQPA